MQRAAPRTILMPTIAVLCVVGAYALRNSFFDVYVMLFFGLLGLAMRWLEMPVVPLNRVEEAGRGRRRALGGLAAAAILVAAVAAVLVLARSHVPAKAESVDQVAGTVTGMAPLAAGDLARLLDTPVMSLSGGSAVWKTEGFETVAGLTRTLGELEDLHPAFATRPGDDSATVIAAQHRMLRWQNALLEKIHNDQSFSFPG